MFKKINLREKRCTIRLIDCIFFLFSELQDITKDICDTDNVEEEKAATKIQAVYRGHRARKSINQGPNSEEVLEESRTMSAMKPEPEPTKEELEAEFSPADKGKNVFLFKFF